MTVVQTPTIVAFSVVGAAKTMGSSKAVPTNRNWQTVPGVRWRVVDSNHDVDAWQKVVASVARGRMLGLDADPFDGPVHLDATFRVIRPKTVTRPHPVGGRDGDLDKYLRAVGDALTGIVWNDDSQVVSITATKTWALGTAIPGVFIRVQEVL